MTDDRRLAGRRVLVVEDDYYLAMDTEDWLRRAGADVLGPVPDERGAADLLEGGGVDCAVLDINLGRGPSFEIAARLQKAQIPFILATGYDAAAVPRAFGHVPRLEKPFREDDLIGAVQRLVG